MRFTLRTRVPRPPAAVFPVFGEAAFVESLAPSIMGLRVVRIGLDLGDEIEVRFTRLGPRGPWISRIDELDRDAAGIRFVDRSLVIPWPFATFEHHHGFLADPGGGTVLVDDVRFTTRPRILGPFVWPFLRLSFGLRRGVYRRRFGRPGGTGGTGATVEPPA
jgi:ligand-binding SRPBCC domain-containing protein